MSQEKLLHQLSDLETSYLACRASFLEGGEISDAEQKQLTFISTAISKIRQQLASRSAPIGDEQSLPKESGGAPTVEFIADSGSLSAVVDSQRFIQDDPKPDLAMGYVMPPPQVELGAGHDQADDYAWIHESPRDSKREIEKAWEQMPMRRQPVGEHQDGELADDDQYTESGEEAPRSSEQPTDVRKTLSQTASARWRTANKAFTFADEKLVDTTVYFEGLW